MDDKTQAQLKEIFDTLPKPIQEAITSAEVQKKMREAADKHKLHIDQWQILEDEVLMSLFGLKPIEELQKNIEKEVGVSPETAAELTGDISEIVFAPIRDELERGLEHPEAKEKEVSGVEQAREALVSEQRIENREQDVDQALNDELRTSRPDAAIGGAGAEVAGPITPTPLATSQPTISQGAPPSVQPATPPPPSPTERAVRAPTSSIYKSGEPSTARKNVHDDPYRESPA